jgi:hypothetical protein
MAATDAGLGGEDWGSWSRITSFQSRRYPATELDLAQIQWRLGNVEAQWTAGMASGPATAVQPVEAAPKPVPGRPR